MLPSEAPSADAVSWEEARGKVHLGQIIADECGITLFITFSRPAPEPTFLLRHQLAKRQDAWKSESPEYSAYTGAQAAVAATEAELATATAEATAVKTQWLSDLDSGSDHTASESAYAQARGKADIIAERLAHQREIVARRKETADLAWRNAFSEALRAEEAFIEGTVRGCREAIAKKFDGDAFDILRDMLLMAVPLKMRIGMEKLLPPL